MIVVSVDRAEKDVVDYDQPKIERLVARDITRPARASVTGQPSIDRALKNQALSTTLRSELIAVAVLFVLLLLALRAPLAAATVTLVGAATVLASYGLMALLARFIETDPIAVALASMTGLALGVGYSLLVLDRFHQLQRAGIDRSQKALASAAEAAVATSGRAVLFAGTGLILALLLATAIAPTKILVSLGSACCSARRSRSAPRSWSSRRPRAVRSSPDRRARRGARGASPATGTASSAQAPGSPVAP